MKTDVVKWTRDVIKAERIGRKVGAWGVRGDRFAYGTREAVALAVFPADIHTPRFPRGVANPLCLQDDERDEENVR